MEMGPEFSLSESSLVPFLLSTLFPSPGHHLGQLHHSTLQVSCVASDSESLGKVWRASSLIIRGGPFVALTLQN
jgi:hypothetical protein